ncbi:Morphogenesis-related protein MSB1 [Candida viswanathii]|uniref:Morphogenesis-related protein MSB1 n=1 Tax=Candida viswanathii TaxID=5486 RepID=A0A367Y5G1_9ASCO|nr:Morphogenesis-related protein MSB1 [Candida viswanathii]
MTMTKTKHNHHQDLNLPRLPTSSNNNNTTAPGNKNYRSLLSNNTVIDAGIMKPDQFTRKNLKSILHIITQELKKRGTKTPHIFLPFRSKINDEKLELFLSSIAPQGELRNHDEPYLTQVCAKTDEFTLICCLKYFWSRLPNNEVIGWDIYLEFKRREKEKGYPKNAFLTIMPKCLSSPAHASIVYDFLDLILSITSNSQFNYLSGRKISKMASFWAFSCKQHFLNTPFYDATEENFETNFIEGVDSWKKSTNALFHLVLAFLRSMLPETNSETLKIPKTLQSLLVTTQYPPSSQHDADRGLLRNSITIPCVCVSTTQPSKNPYELISKVRHSLKFDKKDDFLSIENYTILKNLFTKKGTYEIVNSLTDESKRILSRISAEPIISKFNLVPGWNPSKIQVDPDIPLFSEISIKDVAIQDYFIWTWLSTLSSDQPSVTKQIFGRSIVVEAEVLGFQKWIVITEKTLSSEGYLQRFNLDRRMLSKQHKRQISMEEYRDVPLPPLPSKTMEIPVPKNNNHKPSGSSGSSSSDSEKNSFQSKDLGYRKHSLEGTTTSTSPPPPHFANRESELFEKLFSDEFSYIYPTSVTTQLLREHEEHIQKQEENLVSSKELNTTVSRFTKLTTGDMIPTRHNPTTRKAPPSTSSLDPYTSTPRSLDLISNNRQSGTPDNTFSPSKSDNNTIDTLKEDKYYEPFDVYHPDLGNEKPSAGSIEPFENYYVSLEPSPFPSVGRLQPPQTTSPLIRKPPPLQDLGVASLDPGSETDKTETTIQQETEEDVEEEEEGDDEEDEEEEEEDEETDEEELARRKEEKKRKRKEKKKKLAKRAEAAQLAAAQAAGFPFAILPSNVPPPSIPGAPNSPTKKTKNRDASSTPKKKKKQEETKEDSSPEKKTPKKKKSPKKVKRTPVDQNKPLPKPTEDEEPEVSPIQASASVPDLSPPKPSNAMMNSPSMGFVSSPKIPHTQGLQSMELLVAPKEQYNIFISQHPRPNSPAHPYFMQDEKRSKDHLIPPSLVKNQEMGGSNPVTPVKARKASANGVAMNTQPPAATVFNATPPMAHAQLSAPPPQNNNHHQQPYPPQQSVYNATPPMSHPQLHQAPPPHHHHQQQQQQQHVMKPGYYNQPQPQHHFQPAPPQPQYIPRQQQQQPPPQQQYPQQGYPPPQMGHPSYQQHPYQQQQQYAPPPPQMQYQYYQQPPPMMQNQGTMMQNPRMMQGGGMGAPLNTKSEQMMNMVPMGARHNKNQTANKANLRNAFVQGSFGI